MVFFASDLLGRVGVLPVLDPGGVSAGSDGDGTCVGLAVAAVLGGCDGCSPGI